MAQIRCQCGQVVCEARGDPILTAACYCDDCQAAARDIEAAGDGPPVDAPDGGTELALFRVDRFACVSGEDKLVARKLRPDSITSRFIATCCNSALYIGFDRKLYWVSVMRDRIDAPKPPVEARIMTKFRTSDKPYPDSAPTHARYPVSMFLKVAGARLAMMFGPK